MACSENTGDNQRRAEMAAALQLHLNKLPVGKVRVIVAPKERCASHDLEVWFYHYFVGVAEVHCYYQQPCGTEFFRKHGWIVDVQRLTELRKAFFRAKHWQKEVALLLLTADNEIFLMDMKTIGKRFKEIKSDTKEEVVIPLDWTVRIA